MLKNDKNAYASPQVKLVNVGPCKIVCQSDITEGVNIGSMWTDDSEDDSAFN